jgi:hypothetical protein
VQTVNQKKTRLAYHLQENRPVSDAKKQDLNFNFERLLASQE